MEVKICSTGQKEREDRKKVALVQGCTINTKSHKHLNV